MRSVERITAAAGFFSDRGGSDTNRTSGVVGMGRFALDQAIECGEIGAGPEGAAIVRSN
jgi:hypothetical protein